jgi:hypothetical protein
MTTTDERNISIGSSIIAHLQKRVSVTVAMLSPSRHSGQGGIGVGGSEEIEAESNITAYEKQRNRRKRELHDEVERALLASGFAEVAKLRSLFTGEVGVEGGGGESRRRTKEPRKRSPRARENVDLRRSSWNVANVDALSKTPPAPLTKSTKVHRHIHLLELHVCMVQQTCKWTYVHMFFIMFAPVIVQAA